ncbi:hypothetical protein B0T24DRAFT_708020 [Lasiosphaeria ovina]|uniref:Uncharacterized protein n=1 Tax=Lasiosphaeria ovina TaxID=92902 RepID=A0AAE0K4Y5_9PEZI|nr:hypothetical protein B0T24DRAFT_708020 [Lasiosphaeria ovina]
MSTKRPAAGSKGPEEEGQQTRKAYGMQKILKIFTRPEDDEPAISPETPQPPGQGEPQPAAHDPQAIAMQPPQELEDEPAAAEISLQLWEGAYNALKNADPLLVSKYEDILLQYNRPKLEAAASMMMQLIEAARENVGALLEVYPAAALAWSGFCTITPFLLKPITENKKMHEALDYVIRRMRISMNLAPLLLRDKWKEDGEFRRLRGELFRNIQALYEAMLLFEMNCNAWDDQRKAIEAAEGELNGFMTQYNTEVLKKYQLASAEYLELVNTGMNALANSHTCGWFLGDNRYLEWLHSKDAHVLLVSAPPGCGKSVLSALLIEEELRLQWPDEQICHYFFDNQGEQRKATNGIRALLHQLLSSHPGIVEYVEYDIDKAGSALMGNLGELGQIFNKAVCTKLAGQVICVLDALDECEPEHLTPLVKWLFSPSSRPLVKFLVTARGLPRIREAFNPFGGQFPHISAQDEERSKLLQDEIEGAMKTRFAGFASKHPARLGKDSRVRDNLLALLEKAGRGQRTYLWVKLVFEALDRATVNTQRQWEAIITHPPESIFDAYDSLFVFVNKADEARVRLLLHLIYASNARRPLTVGEANEATTIHLSEETTIRSQEDFEMDLMSDDDFQEWVIKSCGFFVSVYGGQLYFIHQSASEYLRYEKANRPGKAEGSARSLRGSLSDRSAHARAAECCIAYLAMDELASNPKFYNEQEGVRVLSYEAYNTHQFLDYATENWLAHFRFARDFRGDGAESGPVDIDNRFSEMYFSLWTPVSGRLKPAVASSVETESSDWSYEPILASVVAGQAKLVERHLKTVKGGSNILSETYEASILDWRREYPTYPLTHIACRFDHGELLDRGANVDGMGYRNENLEQSLLHLSVRRKSPDMIKMFLKRGATVDADDMNGGTPLALALQVDSDLAVLLLDAGAAWSKAIRYLRREYSEFSTLMKALSKSELASRPGFLEAARGMGFDPEAVESDSGL